MNDYTATSVRELYRITGWRLAGLRFDTFPDDHPARAEALELARIAARDSISLWLHGPYGVGKTGLAVALGADVVGPVNKVTFVPVRQWLARARVGFSRGETLDLELPEDVGTLILDEIGVDRTAWAVETLGALVDGAYGREVQTVATSNYAPFELAERLTLSDDPHAGGRIVSRLCHDATVVRIDAPDLRLIEEPGSGGSS